MDILFHLLAAGAMRPRHVDPRDLSPGGGGICMLFSQWVEVRIQAKSFTAYVALAASTSIQGGAIVLERDVTSTQGRNFTIYSLYEH